MPEPLRVLTSPVRVTGGLRVGHLLTLLCGDAVVRRARADGREVEWIAGVLTGDLASQLAVEQELAREGLDRSAMTRDDFVDRARALEADSLAAAVALLEARGVDVRFDDGEASAAVARTAFVRLFEEGLLTREERVVATCPRAESVVDVVDAEEGTAPATQWTLALDGVDVDVIATELVPAAVAIAVPEEHPAAGSVVELPTVGTAIPVIADSDRDKPALVVPGHDAADLEFARRHNLSPIVVLDRQGTVVTGPLAGLSRYAARAAAAELLEAEGVAVAPTEVDEAVARCRRCGTVLVPRLGQHWFLPMGDLEVLVADAVRQGAITISPASAGDELVASAGQRGDWCLSHQVWAGVPVPVATCLDCGSTAVSVEGAASCGKCMGTLVQDDDVLDARFVAAVWPLSYGTETETLLVVAPPGVMLWAVRIAALGLRLTGSAPFTRVAIHPLADAHSERADDQTDIAVDADWVSEVASGAATG